MLDFLAGRLAVLLKESGHRYDVVDSVLAEQATNPAGALRGVRQLQAWVGQDDWKTILPAFARCVRITRDQKTTYKVDRKAFVEEEEQVLFRELQKAESAVRASRPSTPDRFLSAFVPMIPAVNAYFDKVLVMAKKKVLRENRLGLLQRISALSAGVADLSKLEGF